MKLFTLPNLLTLANLLCGCLVVLCLNALLHLDENIDNSFYLNAIFILLSSSLIFDLMDGMVARAMKINSDIGIQLDSLADMVTFGVSPGFMMFVMLNEIQGTPDLWEGDGNFISSGFGFLPLFGFLISLNSALRLAKFNVDPEQTTYFKGLNTPANTILIFSVFWIKMKNGSIIDPNWDLYLLLFLTLSSFLLISNIPIFSFKFKNLSWKDNHFRFVFLIISALLLILFQMKAVAFIIVLYIIVSIIFRKKIIHA